MYQNVHPLFVMYYLCSIFNLFVNLKSVNGITLNFTSTNVLQVKNLTKVQVMIYEKKNFESATHVSWHLMDKYGREIENLGTTDISLYLEMENGQRIYSSGIQLRYISKPSIVGNEFELVGCVSDYVHRVCTSDPKPIRFPAEWEISIHPPFPLEGSKVLIRCEIKTHRNSHILFQFLKSGKLKTLHVVNLQMCMEQSSNIETRCNESVVDLVFKKEYFSTDIGDAFVRCRDILQSYNGSPYKYLPINETKHVELKQESAQPKSELFLTCSLEGFSGNIDVRWYHYIKKITIRPQKILQSSLSRDGRTLRVNSIDIENIGEYSCQARQNNSKSEISQWYTSNQVSVEHLPIILVNRGTEIFVPITDIKINVSFIANPIILATENSVRISKSDGCSDYAFNWILTTKYTTHAFLETIVNIEIQELFIYADHVNNSFIGKYSLSISNKKGSSEPVLIQVVQERSLEEIPIDKRLYAVFAVFPIIAVTSCLIVILNGKLTSSPSNSVQNVADERIPPLDDLSIHENEQGTDIDGEEERNQYQQIQDVSSIHFGEKNKHQEKQNLESITVLAENDLFHKLIDTEAEDSDVIDRERAEYQELGMLKSSEYSDMGAVHH